MNHNPIVTTAKAYIAKMPERRSEIIAEAEMAFAEVAAGESLDNELELMRQSLEEMLIQEEE